MWESCENHNLIHCGILIQWAYHRFLISWNSLLLGVYLGYEDRKWCSEYIFTLLRASSVTYVALYLFAGHGHCTGWACVSFWRFYVNQIISEGWCHCSVIFCCWCVLLVVLSCVWKGVLVCDVSEGGVCLGVCRYWDSLCGGEVLNVPGISESERERD